MSSLLFLKRRKWHSTVIAFERDRNLSLFTQGSPFSKVGEAFISLLTVVNQAFAKVFEQEQKETFEKALPDVHSENVGKRRKNRLRQFSDAQQQKIDLAPSSLPISAENLNHFQRHDSELSLQLWFLFRFRDREEEKSLETDTSEDAIELPRGWDLEEWRFVNCRITRTAQRLEIRGQSENRTIFRRFPTACSSLSSDGEIKSKSSPRCHENQRSFYCVRPLITERAHALKVRVYSQRKTIEFALAFDSHDSERIHHGKSQLENRKNYHVRAENTAPRSSWNHIHLALSRSLIYFPSYPFLLRPSLSWNISIWHSLICLCPPEKLSIVGRN